MAQVATTPTQAPSDRPRRSLQPAVTPPLETGDRLALREFERRYQAMPRLKKAELIEGVVYMPSPVHFESHAEPHANLMTWLGHYRAAAPGVRMGDNATVRLDADNEVQPDGLLRLEPSQGGRSHITEDNYLAGAPELVIEIAASSATIDLTDKLRVYRRNGVQEYIVWQVYDERLDWFQLREGEYARLTPDAEGVIYSQVFPGLRLNVKAMLEGDLAAVLADLQKGLATNEHRAFIERLSAKP